MGLRQEFSTVIYSWDGNLSVEVLFLPRSDVFDPSKVQDPKSALDSLGASPLAAFKPRDPARALATCLAAVQIGGKTLEYWKQEVKDEQHKSVSISEDQVRFAGELLESSRIPFEESPLVGVPLKDLIAMASKASPTGIGVAVGWAVAGNTPFLFISVPAGIIVVWFAVGFGQGLGQGLQTRIKKLITGKPL